MINENWLFSFYSLEYALERRLQVIWWVVLMLTRNILANDPQFQMWLIIVSFLACFNCGKAKDEFGNEIEVDDSFNEFGVVMYVQNWIPNTDSGLNHISCRHKKPFKCSITPRSEQIQKIIESTVNQ